MPFISPELLWPGRSMQTLWQGDKLPWMEEAPLPRGSSQERAGGSAHPLSGTRPSLEPQRCRIRPSHELTANVAFFCLTLNAKGWGWLCWLFGNWQFSRIHYFYWCSGFNFCKLLSSFAKPMCAFSSRWLNHCSFGNQYLQHELAICETLRCYICAKSPHPYLRSGTEGGKRVCPYNLLAKHFLAISFFKAVSIFGSCPLREYS